MQLKLAGRVGVCESRVEKVEKSISAVPGMVKVIALKMSESSQKLIEVDARLS